MVVLPWVPVMPKVVNARVGWSWNQALSSASRLRGRSTTTVGRPAVRAAPSASVSAATAPAAFAASAKSAPWTRLPGSAA